MQWQSNDDGKRASKQERLMQQLSSEMALLNDSYGREINPVVFEGNSHVKKVILNRPRKFNCVTFPMVLEMTKKLKAYENDPAVKLVILKGSRKQFCAGGDLLSYHKYMTEGHWTFSAFHYRKQLLLNHLLATYKKTLVALIDGRVMGAGAGMSMYAPYRIVTENTVFAMPETAIGYFPDVGASHFLSRLPGYFGEYLGLTGAKLRGAELVACGLATDLVLSKELQMLENAFEGLKASNLTVISQIVSKFSNTETLKAEDAFRNKLKIINRCFSGEAVETILSSLEKELEHGEQKWIIDAITSMKAACPTSLKIFLKSIRQGRYQNLDQCYSREYIIAVHLARTILNSDFLEGLQTVLFEKDTKPKWQPPKLELVREEMVDKFFEKIEDEEWQPLQLPHKSNQPNGSVMSKI